MFGMQNGYTFDARHTEENGWQTVVTSVPEDAAGTLRSGDILQREAQTGMSVDGPESLDAILAELVSENQPQARLNVLRDGGETSAVMPLAQE